MIIYAMVTRLDREFANGITVCTIIEANGGKN
jgi:hypothetical protein